MSPPKELVGAKLRGSCFCENWELRITERCLDEDLSAGVDSEFEATENGRPIVKAFVRERKTKASSTRQVRPLTNGQPVWVVGHGDKHRGGTWYDRDNGVIWLVACGGHRSGATGDFYPYCKQLDADDRLLPSEGDYKRLFDEQDTRFGEMLRVQGPIILRQARERPGAEVRCGPGGGGRYDRGGIGRDRNRA
jgi:hypothetical protein